MDIYTESRPWGKFDENDIIRIEDDYNRHI